MSGNQKETLFLLIMCSLFSILMIALGAGLFIAGNGYSDFKENAIPVTAVISKIETWVKSGNGIDESRIMHRVYVDYKFGGELYEGKIFNYYNSAMDKGDYVEILVGNDNPGEPIYTETNIMLYIGGGIFITTGLLLIVIIIISIKRKLTRKIEEEVGL
ncbi:MAG: hypothetical protein LBV08_06795 [Clostridiales bacterium]|jgi:hypothetical protein|nr:hypothetical protein [Clostridiales bacterium]